jgi:AcrR family transcriptional regulator
MPKEERSEPDARDALMTATESLLVEVGFAAITVRSVAARAGVNHGLVHYYFSSLHELMLRTLERFTSRLIERQATMYSGPGRFIDKWRNAMRYLDEDAASGYQKIWFELQAMSWNDPSSRIRLGEVHRQWVRVVSEALDSGLNELGVDRGRYPTAAVAALVVTFNEGFMLEGVGGVDSGHRDLLRMLDGWIERHIQGSADARTNS